MGILCNALMTFIGMLFVVGWFRKRKKKTNYKSYKNVLGVFFFLPFFGEINASFFLHFKMFSRRQSVKRKTIFTRNTSNSYGVVSFAYQRGWLSLIGYVLPLKS